MMPPEVFDKFAKVLGLLGSDQAGERASAAKIATAILRQCKMTWEDIARKLQQSQAPSSDFREGFQSLHFERVNELLAMREYLTGWEVNFLTSIKFRPSLSRKQDETLTRIYDRVSSAVRSWQG